MEKRNPILDLIDLRAARQFTPPEMAELDRWIAASPDTREKAQRQAFVDKLAVEGHDPATWLEEFDGVAIDESWTDEQVQPTIDRSLALYRLGKARRRKMILYRYMSAASIILILSMTALFYDDFKRIFLTTDNVMTQNPDRITPTNDAVLIYGNNVVQLDSLSQHPMNQPGTSIHLKDRELVYQDTDATSAPLANKIMTIPGKRFRVTLSDGTRVWLNGNSSLEYPNRFTGQTREVTLKGEGFFEVTASAQHPFVVRSGGHRVTVLGTRFNLEGYDSTDINTTLLDGAVAIKTSKTTKKLKPGYTANVNMEEPTGIRIEAADTATISAWTSGRIAFNNVQIDSLLNRLTNIYDFGYTMTGNHRRRYSGVFSLNETAEQILRRIELNQDITFKWNREGRHVEVTLK